MKKAINIISVLLVLCTVLSLSSCRKKTDADEPTQLSRPSKEINSETVKIVNVPTEKDDVIKMLNAALDYIDVYCYSYKKQIKCDVSGIDAGSLSAVSNATDAFESIFGQADSVTDYDYKADEELFNANFPKSGFTSAMVAEATATASDDGKIISVTLKFPNESNSTENSGVLAKLGGEYIGEEKLKENLKEFDSSANSVSFSASGIYITARINADDSSLATLEVGYTESFSLSGVTLVKLDGGTVHGTSEFRINYTDFRQN